MRELKTPQQISHLIMHRLLSFPECADAEATVQNQLQESDPDDCNASRDLILSYGESDSDAVLRHLRPLHQAARRRFNVGE